MSRTNEIKINLLAFSALRRKGFYCRFIQKTTLKPYTFSFICFLFFNSLIGQNKYIDLEMLYLILEDELNIEQILESNITKRYDVYTFTTADKPLEVNGHLTYQEFSWISKRAFSNLDLEEAKSNIITQFQDFGYQIVYENTKGTLLTFENATFSLEPILIELLIPDSYFGTYVSFTLIDVYSENKKGTYDLINQRNTSSFFATFPDFKVCQEYCESNTNIQTYYKHFYKCMDIEYDEALISEIDIFNKEPYSKWKRNMEYSVSPDGSKNHQYVREKQIKEYFKLNVVHNDAREKRYHLLPVPIYIHEKFRSKAVMMDVLCEQNLSFDMIIYLKESLKEKGFYYGEINDSHSEEFQIAINTFQKFYNLPTGHLNLETLKLL